MTPVEAGKLVTLLANAPDGEGQAAWTLETQEVFAQLIEDLDFEPTKAAVMTWLKTQRRRPSIADIRSACRQQLEQAGAIPTDPDVDQAWGIVLEVVRHSGRYQPFPNTYPRIKAAVDRMGWEEICNAENIEVLRAQFERFYRAELTREREARHAAPALARPDDRARLEGSATPQALSSTGMARALPAPPERVVAVDSIRQIREHLRHGLRAVPDAPAAEVKERPTLRVPTAEERSVEEQRKAALREQAERLKSA